VARLDFGKAGRSSSLASESSGVCNSPQVRGLLIRRHSSLRTTPEVPSRRGMILEIVMSVDIGKTVCSNRYTGETALSMIVSKHGERVEQRTQKNSRQHRRSDTDHSPPKEKHSPLILRHAILLDWNRTARLASISIFKTGLDKETTRHAVQSVDGVAKAVTE
jgi:hypothetical protein